MSPQVLKVHLSAQPEVYGRASAELTGDKVNKNLLLDSRGQHLYITREKRVRPRHLPQLLSIRPHRSKQIKDFRSFIHHSFMSPLI